MGDQNTLGLVVPSGGTLILGTPYTAGYIEHTIACSIP